MYVNRKTEVSTTVLLKIKPNEMSKREREGSLAQKDVERCERFSLRTNHTCHYSDQKNSNRKSKLFFNDRKISYLKQET